MTDINVGAITEALNDKTDRDLQNVDTTAKADAVIDFQLPTAENNYTWYRKYKSGWVEQGCHTISPGTTWTLPIPMADDKYTLVASYIDSSSTNEPQWQYMGIQQYATHIIPKASGISQRIYICGMAAQ